MSWVPRLRSEAGARIAALLLASLASAQSTQQAATSQPDRDERPRLVVVGFQPAQGADSRDDWIPVAVEETLARRLRRVPGLIAPPAARAYHARQELTDGKPPDWPHVLSMMGATHHLTGYCHGPQSQTTIELVLTRADDLAAAPLARVELPPARLFDALDAATRWTLTQMRIDGAHAELIFAPPARTPSALEYFAKAVSAVRRGDGRDAEHYAGQAAHYDKQCRPALLLITQLQGRSGTAAPTELMQRLQLVIEQAQRDHDPLDLVEAELALAELTQRAGSGQAAMTRLEHALAVAYEQREIYGELASINAIADWYLRQTLPVDGLTEEQLRAYARSQLQMSAEWQAIGLDMLRGLEDVVGAMPAANKLALTFERLDRQAEALALHEFTLTAAERVGSRRNETTARLYIGQWHVRNGRPAEAVTILSRCLAVAPDEAKSAVQLALGEAFEAAGRPEDALAALQAAYEQIRNRGQLASELTCLRRIAQLQWQLGQYEIAVRSLEEAITVAHALGGPAERELHELRAKWNSERSP